MPFSTDIYQNVGNQSLAGGLAGALNQFTEQRARLSDLAAQREQQAITQGYQNRALQRAEEAIPAQQAQAQRAQMEKVGREIDLGIYTRLQGGVPKEEVAQWAQQTGLQSGLKPEQIQAGIAPMMQIQEPEKLLSYYQRSAMPQEYMKAELESQFRKPEKADEGTPVDIMQGGKPVKIMSKSGRIVGEAVPTKALVNIGVGEPAPKVSPGTRVWREGGEWKTEVMQGTPQWQALKSKEATDRAFVQNFVPSLEKNVTDIEKLTKHKGFDSIFGKVGGIASLDVLPSTLEARAQLEQVVGAMETAGMQMQKSTAGSAGSMSVQEWPKMQTYLNLVKTATTPEQAKEALRNAVQSYQRMQEVGKESYMNEWGTGQFGDKTVIDRLSKYTKGHEKPNATQAYEGDKEARYQAWKASQGR